MESRITAADKAAFEESGYHHLRGALSPEELATYRDAMAQVLQTPRDHPYAQALLLTARITPAPPDNPHAVWAGFDLPLFDDRFYDIIFQPTIALAVDALIGPDINCYETSFVSKIPGFSASYRDWHQDSEYSKPQTNDRMVTVAIYLDDMDRDTGATWVVPGSHKLGELPHVTPTESLSSRAREVADKERFEAQGVCPTFAAGDAMIFLTRVIHRAGGNHSDRTRSNILINYVRRDNLDLGEINHYIGAGVPVTRGGRLYAPWK